MANNPAEYRGDVTMTFAAATAQYLRVKPNSSTGYAEVAGTTARGIGCANRQMLAAGDEGSVRPFNDGGVFLMVASEAISAFASVYAAASGKVASTGTVIIGTARTAATANNDIIAVYCDPISTDISGGVDRTSLVQDDLVPYTIPWSDFRVHDAPMSVLPATQANDDLGFILGTPGTDYPVLKGVDGGGTTETQHARFYFAVPAEYVAGETITLRVNASMQVDGDGAQTVDAIVHNLSNSATADICATAATAITSTAGNKDFTLTPTNVEPGDLLTVKITTTVTDVGNAAANINSIIHSVALLLDIQG